MQNVIPQNADVVLPSTIPLSALLYANETGDYTMLVTDALGRVMDVIEVDSTDLTSQQDVFNSTLENFEIKPDMIYLVSVTFHDVFFIITKIHSVLKSQKMLETFFQENGKPSENFTKAIFQKLRRSQYANQLN